MAKTKLWLALMCLGCCLLVNGQGSGQSGRNIVLIYDILNYNQDIGDSVQTLMAEIIKPDDQLLIIAPTKKIGLSKETLAKPKERLAEKIKDVLKRDAAIAGMNYNTTFTDMKSLVLSIRSSEAGGDIGSLLSRYIYDREQMFMNRRINQPLLMEIAAFLKAQAGENILVIVFEKSYRPIPGNEVMDLLRQNRDLAFHASDAFIQENLKELFSEDALIQSMREARTMVHYVYYTSKSPPRGLDFRVVEDSGYFNNFYRKLAQKSQGTSEATAKPEAAIKKILQ